jgi:hypothetical protein
MDLALPLLLARSGPMGSLAELAEWHMESSCAKELQSDAVLHEWVVVVVLAEKTAICPMRQNRAIMFLDRDYQCEFVLR